MNKIVIFFLLILMGCGIESGSDKRDSFEFQLQTNCPVGGSATQCLEANNGRAIRAYAILETCNDLFAASADSSEFTTMIAAAFATASSTVNCTSSTCTSSLTNWSASTPQGSTTIVIAIDSDSDEVFGEAGEPYVCEDDVNFANGVTETIRDSSADLGYEDIL